MCGIHLIIAKKNTPHDVRAALHRMMDLSAHRGPDATQVLHWTGRQQQVFLGSQRLKITDLDDRANQPMVSADERYALLYNGALYNFPELRNELLGQGEIFSTYSDTEVVLKMLIRQGKAALSQLEGMFALAFYDRKEERLLLARDPLGIKPLYYAENEQFFVVSSSSQSILASGLVSTELATSQIDHYFCFRYPQKGRTLYREVRALSEGTYLTHQASSASQNQKFTNFPEEKRDTFPPETETQKKVEELLKDALLRHLSADVPCGLFLSGGVDSTLLLALMKEVGVSPIPTFSIVNGAQEKHFGTEDYQYAQQAAQQFGSYHREVSLTQSLFEENFEKFIQQSDQPIGDSGALMTYLLSQEARQHVKVVLSGAGADELFGGYNRHQAYYRYLKHYSLFKWLAKPSKALASVLPSGFNHPLRKPFRLFKKFAGSLSDDPETTFLQFVTSSNLKDCSSVTPADDSSSEKDFVERHLSFALQHDQQNYLVEDVLQMSDVSSMAHSLELRVPYLDAPLVRYVESLPATFRLKYGRKWMLQNLLNQYGGKPFTRRAKEGFGLPFGYWLREEKSTIIRQYLEDDQLPIYQYISFNPVNQLLTSHRKGHQDYSAELWSVMLLSAWLSHQDF
ncbi:asparagine synthase (glutamine-hydrolyzing) [Tunicatimonas pelagia]|uniref:asparagine synthase (glutamine-hydrolyzing) n=1 Tax=Tunicatimonas pelagia TaxID=931531 RepID=UPI00266527A0|nr:asparagine synthase (glutamine-hydrolyzing) [Tunicatimonas pelagia]WKN40454.1 asparagine synthase (glutamine-hydrolyzing) [Tunicatimonas pelagia]